MSKFTFVHHNTQDRLNQLDDQFDKELPTYRLKSNMLQKFNQVKTTDICVNQDLKNQFGKYIEIDNLNKQTSFNSKNNQEENDLKHNNENKTKKTINNTIINPFCAYQYQKSDSNYSLNQQ